ncbi:MAG: GDSL-type esterase/lipase family protein [Gemmatimonadetes bacterium]|nr:GDSL-type esterase/lipase family protein [Gemmatimonadota bacterium]
MILGQAELHNVHELLDDPGGTGSICCRVPNDLRVTLNESAKNNALQASGCEIRFNLEGQRAVITLQSPEGPTLAEVYQGDYFSALHIVDAAPTRIVVERPDTEPVMRRVAPSDARFDTGLSRVVLPWRPSVRLISIEGETSLPRPDQAPKTRYLAYGSSITHGSTAVRPTGTYPARTAEILGTDLFNLGFGGGAHMEAGMADYIAGRDDWDIATLEMGINVVQSFDVDEFHRRVEYFVTAIADAHPDDWIFCIDIFPCLYDFMGVEKCKTFRSIVAERVSQLNRPKLVHIPGDAMLRSNNGLTVDLVHPAPGGFEEMARNLADIIRARRK